MKILFQIALEYIKKNKRWSLTTILSIALSMMLITVVVIFGFSFLNTIIENARNSSDDFILSNTIVPARNYERVKAWEGISKLNAGASFGSISIEDTYVDGDEQYTYFMESNLQNYEGQEIELISGRYPENETEVIVAQYVLSVKEEQENLKTDKGLYKIVGIFRPDKYWNSVFTKSDAEPVEYIMDVALENPTKENYQKFLNLAQPRSSMFTLYGESLGLTSGNSYRTSIIGLIQIVGGFFLGIILISSIAVINNAISIASTQQEYTFSQLFSVGATYKQQSLVVLFEALIIGILGIVFGLGLGLLSSGTLINYISKNLSITGGTFVVDFPLWIFPVVFFFGLLLILFSSFRPIQRIVKSNVVETLKFNRKIKEKKEPFYIKKSDFMTRFAHMNYNASKRQFNKVLIALAVAIVVFITVNSLTMTMRESMLNEEPNIFVNGFYDASIDHVANHDEVLGRINDLLPIKNEITSYHPAFGYDLSTPDNSYNNRNYYGGYISIIEDEKFIELYGSLIPVFVNKITYNDMYGEMLSFEPINTTSSISMINFQSIEKTNNSDHFKSVMMRIVDEAPQDLGNELRISNIILPLSFALEDDFFKIGRYMSSFSIENYKIQDDEVIKQLQEEFSDSTSFLNEYEFNRTMNQLTFMLSLIINLFVGFVTLISISNIFNTLTTQFLYRSKEFALLEAIGTTEKQMRKMIIYESIITIVRAVIWGFGISLLLYGLIKILEQLRTFGAFTLSFPTLSYVIVLIALIILVLSISLYSLSLIKKQNLMDKLKQQF